MPHSIRVGSWSVDTSHKALAIGSEGSMLSLDGIPLLGTLDWP